MHPRAIYTRPAAPHAPAPDAPPAPAAPTAKIDRGTRPRAQTPDTAARHRPPTMPGRSRQHARESGPGGPGPKRRAPRGAGEPAGQSGPGPKPSARLEAVLRGFPPAEGRVALLRCADGKDALVPVRFARDWAVLGECIGDALAAGDSPPPALGPDCGDREVVVSCHVGLESRSVDALTQLCSWLELSMGRTDRRPRAAGGGDFYHAHDPVIRLISCLHRLDLNYVFLAAQFFAMEPAEAAIAQALANQARGKSPPQMRSFLYLPDDLSPEEAAERLRSVTWDLP